MNEIPRGHVECHHYQHPGHLENTASATRSMVITSTITGRTNRPSISFSIFSSWGTRRITLVTCKGYLFKEELLDSK